MDIEEEVKEVAIPDSPKTIKKKENDKKVAKKEKGSTLANKAFKGSSTKQSRANRANKYEIKISDADES